MEEDTRKIDLTRIQKRRGGIEREPERHTKTARERER
jgi:hypothetical protein